MSRFMFAGVFLACFAQTVDAEEWELVFSEDFSSPKSLEQWRLEGAAAVSVTADGRLLIETQRKEIEGKRVHCSVLWFSRPFSGDLRFEFDAWGAAKNRCIFFFNAQPRQGHRSIFEWKRPRAPYEAYSNDLRIQLYTLGILRHDEEFVNLRHLGSRESIETWNTRKAVPNRKENKKELKRLWDLFQEQTVIFRSPSPFKDENAAYHFDVRVIKSRLIGYVNGNKLFDFVDEKRRQNPLNGGFFGFRNFRPTLAWYDNLRVYRGRKGKIIPEKRQTQ